MTAGPTTHRDAERRHRPGPDRPAEPTREDTFVRGVSEVVGGPTGEHATRTRSRAAGIIIVLALLTFGLHWVQKSPCMDGAWSNHKQYTEFCYTDVLALYYAEGLDQGKVPYVDQPVEYPVLTGYFMGAGRPTDAQPRGGPARPQPG